jgi:CheY-like chemotaxis protein
VALQCLIVDDNVDFLQAARDLLESDGIEVVAVATTGDEAMACAAELRPDVILVDVYLANESGFDLAQRFSDGAGLAPSPIVLISTYAERDLEELVTASPAVGFLSKDELSGTAIRSALGLEDSRPG